MKNKFMEKKNGITLVALVVTIVVLLILAGITIMYTMGENSIFKKAQDAKDKTEIAKWQERLEAAKGVVIIDGLGTFDIEKYKDYIEEQEIIENRETDVTKNEDGTYEVTTKPGYIFQVELVPSKENPTDAKIEYVGKNGTTTDKIYVQSITLNKTEETIIEDGTTKLTATVNPDNVENKEIEWKSSDETVATVDNTGLVTGLKIGEVTITAKATDGSNKIAECRITVETNWELMSKIAKEIANDSSITSSSNQATVTVEGKSKTINVGGIYDVRYNGEKRRVRVLGFKHDDLVDKTVYGGNHTKAGISFEFLDFMTGSTYKSMNSTDTNSGGWANTQMRKDLNGYTTNAALQGGTIRGLGTNLTNKSYVKQVKKKYIAAYNDASSVTTCNDYLWLLAASEVMKDGYQSGAYGIAIASEGSQYKYYQGVTDAWNNSSVGRQKKPNLSDEPDWWWLRSTSYGDGGSFSYLSYVGQNFPNIASNGQGVAPGFCI